MPMPPLLSGGNQADRGRGSGRGGGRRRGRAGELASQNAALAESVVGFLLVRAKGTCEAEGVARWRSQL